MTIARRACRSCPARAARAGRPRMAQRPLAIFFAATATILLIGCVNLANLMFARGAARVGEIAVRASLGAARRRLVSLLSVEALLLAGFAAVASLPVALGVLRAIDALQPPGLSAGGAGLDPRAVAAAFAIAVLATLVFALLPISKLVATDPVRALQGNSARAFGGKNLGRFRFGLATSQIALSMLLLVLAALFTQSLANIARVDLGLRTESIVTFQGDAELERLHRRAAEADARRDRARACSRARRHARRHGDGGVAGGLRSGGPASSSRVSSRRSDSDRDSQRQQRRHGVLGHARHSVARRPQFHGGRHARSAARCDRQREFREAFRTGRKPSRRAGVSRVARAASRSRSSGSLPTRRTTPSRAHFPRRS